MTRIDIGKDFSDVPLGRFKADGNFSGERFRDEKLAPAMKKAPPVHVRIDHVEGYGSSFLEEAFGGLVRKSGFNKADVERDLVIELEDKSFETYRDLIWSYIRKA